MLCIIMHKFKVFFLYGLKHFKYRELLTETPSKVKELKFILSFLINVMIIGRHGI